MRISLRAWSVVVIVLVQQGLGSDEYDSQFGTPVMSPPNPRLSHNGLRVTTPEPPSVLTFQGQSVGDKDFAQLLHLPGAAKVLNTTGKPPSRFDGDTCDVSDCPLVHPVLYFVVPYRNRAFALKRALLSLAYDVKLTTALPKECICLVVGDFDDVVIGPSVDTALEVWPYNKHLVRLSGPFYKNLGIQLPLEVAMQTPPNRSILASFDTDFFFLHGFIADVLRFTSGGLSVPFPLYFYLKTQRFHITAFHATCRGLFSMYVSDLYAAGGFSMTTLLDDSRLPLDKFPLWLKKSVEDPTVWGGEDTSMFWLFQVGASSAKPLRFVSSNVIHFDHPHDHAWSSSSDGVGGKGDPFELMPYFDNPPWFPWRTVDDLPDPPPRFYKRAVELLHQWASKLHQFSARSDHELEVTQDVLQRVYTTHTFQRYSPAATWDGKELRDIDPVSLYSPLLSAPSPSPSPSP